MGSEVAYRDEGDEPLYATRLNDGRHFDVSGLLRDLADDIDDATILAQRIRTRRAELARIDTTLSDNLAPQAPKALPTSTIRDYRQSERVQSTTSSTPAYIEHGNPHPFFNNKKFYEKTWFKASAIGLLIAGFLSIVVTVVVMLVNALTRMVASVGSWWAENGASVIGAVIIIAIVLLVLLFGGSRGGTFSGTFKGTYR